MFVEFGGRGAPYVSGGDQYEIQVSGSVAKGPNASSQDSVRGGTINGKIGDGVDDFQYTGEVTSAAIPSHSKLIIDGQEVDPTALPLGSDGYQPPGSTSSGSSGGSSSGSTAPATAGGGDDSTLLVGGVVLILLAAYWVMSQ